MLPTLCMGSHEQALEQGVIAEVPGGKCFTSYVIIYVAQPFLSLN